MAVLINLPVVVMAIVVAVLIVIAIYDSQIDK